MTTYTTKSPVANRLESKQIEVVGTGVTSVAAVPLLNPEIDAPTATNRHRPCPSFVPLSNP